MINLVNKENVEDAFSSYKENKREIVDENLPIPGRNFRVYTRPVQRALLWGQRKIKGQTIEVMGNRKYKIPKGRNVTFVVSHIGKFDFEIVNELIKRQFYVLASDYRNMYGTINETMMKWFGVWFVDELDKNDRFYTSEVNKKTLADGYNTMILAEGTWNISENQIIYNLSFGAVDGAIVENALILPIAVEQYDDRFVVNFGEFFDPTCVANAIPYYLSSYKSGEKYSDNDLEFLKKSVANNMLRDQLATLKYEIWEREGVSARKDISADYWEKFVAKRVDEWPGYSMDEQIDSVYHPDEEILHATVLDELVAISLNHPGILPACDLVAYLSDKERNILISESLNRLEEEINTSLKDTLPLEERLQNYKQLKLKKDNE